MSRKTIAFALGAALLATGPVSMQEPVAAQSRVSKEDAPAAAMLDTQLGRLRAKLDRSPCRVPYLGTGRGAMDTPLDEDEDYTAESCGYDWVPDDLKRVGWEQPEERRGGELARVDRAVMAAFAPLARREFAVYAPYGRIERAQGVEYLLRDGRTILSVRMQNSGFRERPKKLFELAVFDVRSVPQGGIYARGVEPDWDKALEVFSGSFDPPDLKALREYQNALGNGRRIDPALLTPASSRIIEIDPALRDLGLDLAELRWERLDYITRGMAPIVGRVRGQAHRRQAQVDAFHRRVIARAEAQWRADAAASVPETSPIAAGIAQGLANTAATQQFWNRRAAEANRGYFAAARAGARSGSASRAGEGTQGDESGSGPASQASRGQALASGPGGSSGTAANPGSGSGSSSSGPGIVLTRTENPAGQAVPAPAAKPGPEALTVRVSGERGGRGNVGGACRAAEAEAKLSAGAYGRFNERNYQSGSCSCRITDDGFTKSEFCSVQFSFMMTPAEAEGWNRRQAEEAERVRQARARQGGSSSR